MLLFSHERAFLSLLKKDWDGTIWNKIFCEKQDIEDRFARELIAEGHDCTLYFLSYKRDRKEGVHKFGHKVIRLPIDFSVKGIFGSELSFSLLTELSSQAYDVVLIYSSYYTQFIPFVPDMHDLFALFCIKKRLRIISTYSGGSHKKMPPKYLAPLKWWIKKRVLMLSDSIISESKTEVENLGKVFKIERKKIAYLRNCVDLNTFHTIPRDYCARVLHKEDCKKYILFVGHISRNKGIYDLIDVFKIINNEDPNIHLLIVGYGPDKSDVAKKIEQMGLNNYVSFEGLVLHENLKLYYNLASVFVLPSYSEGMPNVVMEAIACNALTVATTVGDIDSLPDSLLLKIPPGNKALLFQALKKVINGGFRIDELERNAFLKECSTETHKEGLKRLIENLSVS